MKKIIAIKVTPNAKANQIIGFVDNTLKVKIKAPAQEGKANIALVEFLAKSWGIPQRQIRILRGETTRNKTLEVTGEIDLPRQLEIDFQ